MNQINTFFASIHGNVPEVPNLFTFVRKWYLNTEYGNLLQHWESLIFSTFIAIMITVVFRLGLKHKSIIPNGLQNFVEWVVEGIYNFIIEVLGKDGEKYVPFLGTLFIYILSMNWLVLIPFMKPPSSDLNVTVALAIVVFCLVQYLNIRNYGILGFLYHMAGSPKDAIGWIMSPLMFTTELFTQFSRPVTLALRLFGNVVGEDILIGVFAFFGVFLFGIHQMQVTIPIPLQLPFLFLAMLTGLMQAMVFTLLSTIYILLSVPVSHDD